MVTVGRELSNSETLLREAIMILIDGALVNNDQALFTELSNLVKNLSEDKTLG